MLAEGVVLAVLNRNTCDVEFGCPFQDGRDTAADAGKAAERPSAVARRME